MKNFKTRHHDFCIKSNIFVNSQHTILIYMCLMISYQFIKFQAETGSGAGASLAAGAGSAGLASSFGLGAGFGGS